MSIRIGIALRYKDDLLEGATTVEEHNKIFHKMGKVWFGKFGVPVNSATLRLLSEPDVEATLILIRSKQAENDDQPRFFSAHISKAQNSHPKSVLIPPYYRKQSYVDTWFCLTTKIRPMNTAKAKYWVTVSSGEPLLATARNCPRTFFLVSRKADLRKSRVFLARFTGKVAAATGPKPPWTRHRDRTVFADDFNSTPEDPDMVEAAS